MDGKVVARSVKRKWQFMWVARLAPLFVVVGKCLIRAVCCSQPSGMPLGPGTWLGGWCLLEPKPGEGSARWRESVLRRDCCVPGP